MKIVRNTKTTMTEVEQELDKEMIMPLPMPPCDQKVTTSNESYSKYSETTFERDGWRINRSYSENRSTWQGEENFYASQSTNKEKDGSSEYINRSYSVNNGMVTVSYSKGTTKSYPECDMSYEDWKFEVFED